MNLVIVGHVDAGKSTTTGHLLFKLGGLPERELEKLRAEAKAQNKESFVFAFFMDRHKEERERGVTIACTTKEFFTPNYHYTIIDAPGHRDFIKNMISGASQAEVALLMVPSNKGGFETSIAKGNHKSGEVQGQTRQHAQLCYLLGIEQLIVGINKMDDPQINYSEERYNEIKSEVTKMLNRLGWKPRMKSIPFIPMSGWKGDNLVEKSDKMPWYKGWKCAVGKETVEGFTLLDALDKIVKAPERPVDAAFRLPVSSILKIKGVGDVVTGKIEQGIIKPNTNVGFAPGGVKGKVFSIEMHHKSVGQAGPGDNVGICVKGLKKENMPKPGDCMFIENDPKDKNPPAKVKSFTALVFVQQHPGQLKPSNKEGKGGFTPTIHVRTAKVPCQMRTLHWKKGKSTNGAKVEDPPYVSAGDQAEVTFVPKMPFFVSAYNDCKGLGRVAVMESHSLVMLGKVSKVEYLREEAKKEKK